MVTIASFVCWIFSPSIDPLMSSTKTMCFGRMTNGTVVVLGETGRNFAAGMSGGEAFVLDVADSFLDRYNPGMVEVTRVERGSEEERRLQALVAEHVAETASAYGRHVLEHWAEARDLFWRVLPNRTPAKADSQALMHVPRWNSRTIAGELHAAAVRQPPQKIAAAAAAFSTLAADAPTQTPRS